MSSTPVIDEVIRVARMEAFASSLPGYFDGPADAVTHIVGAAELRRRAGYGVASNSVNLGEFLSRLQHSNREPSGRSASAMDHVNNAIGLEIGGRAGTYREVVEMAREAIARGIAANGTGEGGTPVWLPAARWAGDIGRVPTSPGPLVWNPRELGGGTYAQAGVEHTHLYGTARWREAERLREIAAIAPEGWSDAEVRAIIRSRPYQDGRDPENAIWQQRVREHFEHKVRREQEDRDAAHPTPRQRSDTSSGGGGGVVHVDAYSRRGTNGSVQVSSHQRSAPN